MTALFFYIGRALQLSGLALGLMVVLLFFNPANGESLLLLLTVASAGVFYGGHALASAGSAR